MVAVPEPKIINAAPMYSTACGRDSRTVTSQMNENKISEYRTVTSDESLEIAKP